MSDPDVDVGRLASAANDAHIARDILRDALGATWVEVNVDEQGVRVQAFFEGFTHAAAAYDKLADVTAAFKTAGSDVTGEVHYDGLRWSDDDRPAAVAEAVFFATEEEEEQDGGVDFETTAKFNVEIGDVDLAQGIDRDTIDRRVREIMEQVAREGGA